MKTLLDHKHLFGVYMCSKLEIIHLQFPLWYIQFPSDQKAFHVIHIVLFVFTERIHQQHSNSAV